MCKRPTLGVRCCLMVGWLNSRGNLRFRPLDHVGYRKKTCSHHFALGIGPGAAARTINGAGAWSWHGYECLGNLCAVPVCTAIRQRFADVHYWIAGQYFPCLCSLFATATICYSKHFIFPPPRTTPYLSLIQPCFFKVVVPSGSAALPVVLIER